MLCRWSFVCNFVKIWDVGCYGLVDLSWNAPSVRPSSNMTERPAAPCFDLSRRAGRPRRGGRGVTCGDNIGGGGPGNPQAGPPVPTGCATTARTRGSTSRRISWATCWWRATRCPAAWVCSAAEAATGTDTGSYAVVDPGAAGRAEAVRGRGGRRRGWRRWQQRQQWWRQRRLQQQRVKPE